MSGTVYTTEGYGFLCLPRSISQRLAEQNYIFSEADAWLDLWCHTIWRDPRNAFSFLAPTAQFGAHGAVLTLETLGQRWGWEMLCHIEYMADILTVGNLEERVAVVDELMKDGKITFLQDYTARKKKEVAQHGEEPENA